MALAPLVVPPSMQSKRVATSDARKSPAVVLGALGQLLRSLGGTSGGFSASFFQSLTSMIREASAEQSLFGDWSPMRESFSTKVYDAQIKVRVSSSESPEATKNALMGGWKSEPNPPRGTSKMILTLQKPISLASLTLQPPAASERPQSVEILLRTSDSEVWHPVTTCDMTEEAIAFPMREITVTSILLRLRGFGPENSQKVHSLGRIDLTQFADKDAYPALDDTVLAVTEFLSSACQPEACSASGELAPSAVHALEALQAWTLATESMASLLHVLSSLLRIEPFLPKESVKSTSQFLRQLAEMDSAVCRNLWWGGTDTADSNSSTAAKFLRGPAHCSAVDILRDGTGVRSTSSPAYAILNRGFTSGRVSWKMKLEVDSNGSECTCFGVAFPPISNPEYNRCPDWVMWRCFNGEIYQFGSSTGTNVSKVHPGDVVELKLDMDKGVCHGAVNGESQGIIFRNLKGRGRAFPAVSFYSNGKEISLVELKSASGPTGVDYLARREPTVVGAGKVPSGETDSYFLATGDTLPQSADAMVVAFPDGALRRAGQGLGLPLPEAGADRCTVAYEWEAKESGGKEKVLFDRFRATLALACPPMAVREAAAASRAPSARHGRAVAVDEDDEDEEEEEDEEQKVSEDNAAVAAGAGVAESKGDEEGDEGAPVGSDAVAQLPVGDGSSLTISISVDGAEVYTSGPLPVAVDGALLPLAHPALAPREVSVPIALRKSMTVSVHCSRPLKHVYPVLLDARVEATPWEQEVLHCPPVPDMATMEGATPAPFSLSLRLAHLLQRWATVSHSALKDVPQRGTLDPPPEVARPMVLQPFADAMASFQHVLDALLSSWRQAGAGSDPAREEAEEAGAAAVLATLDANFQVFAAYSVHPAECGFVATEEESNAGPLGQLQRTLAILAESPDVPRQIASTCMRVLDNNLALLCTSRDEQEAVLRRVTDGGKRGVVELSGPFPTASDSASSSAVALSWEQVTLVFHEFFRSRGWRTELRSLWKRTVHLVATPPIDAAEPEMEVFLLQEAPLLFRRVGVRDWSFPQGSRLKKIPFRISRSLESGQGTVWSAFAGPCVSVYAVESGTMDDVMRHLEGYMGREADAAAADAQRDERGRVDDEDDDVGEEVRSEEGSDEEEEGDEDEADEEGSEGPTAADNGRPAADIDSDEEEMIGGLFDD